MAFYIQKIYSPEILKFGSKFVRTVGITENRYFSTGSDVQRLQTTKDEKDKIHDVSASVNALPQSQKVRVTSHGIPSNIRFLYPEFIPHPHIPWRNPVKEKLERQDMIRRRSQIHIPEFYVGCVLRVIRSNVHQSSKSSEFVGICTKREGTGLKASFCLRNTVDNLGIEINYRLYDPTLQKIEVLRLEKRLDDDLGYLRDAYPEYCTFPMDMKAEVRRGDEVPLNPIKVKLKPRPWFFNWHKRDIKGVEDIKSLLSKKMILTHQPHVKPWEKYDLMQEYRRTIPEEEQTEIYSEVFEELKKTESMHARKKRTQ